MIENYLKCLNKTKESIDAEFEEVNSEYNRLVEAIANYNQAVCHLSIRLHQATQVATFVGREAEDAGKQESATEADSICWHFDEMMEDIPPVVNIEE